MNRDFLPLLDSVTFTANLTLFMHRGRRQEILLLLSFLSLCYYVNMSETLTLLITSVPYKTFYNFHFKDICKRQH